MDEQVKAVMSAVRGLGAAMTPAPGYDGYVLVPVGYWDELQAAVDKLYQ